MKTLSKIFAIAVILVIMILVTVDLHTMAYPVEEATANATIQVDPDLPQLFADKGEAGYLIYFRDEADLSAAYEMDWEARGKFVIAALQETAVNSQKSVQSYLEKEGVKYQSFWIDNIIVVENSSLNTFRGLMSFNEIEALISRQVMQVIEPEGEIVNTPYAITAVEPNIDHVGAPLVWSSGIRGETMVVASIDTGVRSSHDALVRQYRGTATGSHDYNWLGAVNDSAIPVDDYGHGTHTMGTIVGEDASLANQIGMAPGAQWIACDACDVVAGCPDVALLSCAQWIAAPYPIGDPSSPEPSMRPHVVNNSWGGCELSYDNWYQGSVDAWHAAGIYPIFANGNAGNCGYNEPPGLGTVGNPARYGNVTGVGSSGESNGQYASHANWGPTDNVDTVNPQPNWADLKPQVVAPGVSIRSSTPGSDSQYQDGWSGTSMSAPHVTGLVALMWQAGSCLVGDYATTETIIEQTATPIYYDDGSGDRSPNYATGWGEINAAAAVQGAIATCDSIDTIVGTVTDDNTSAPLADVDVVATQSITISRSTQTDNNGEYAIGLVPEGSYTVTASLFGYLPAEVTGVSVISGTTTTLDIALSMVPSALITGYVTDATTGWPLYANVVVEGTTLDAWTNPETGYYSLYLPLGLTYTLTASAWSAGYDMDSAQVGPVTNDENVDFALTVDSVACVAPGYVDTSLFYQEHFDSWPPAGWTITDNGTSGCPRANDADDISTGVSSGSEGNLTGGTGTFVDADSDNCGYGTSMNTDMTSPIIDLSDVSTAALTFRYDYRHFGDQLGSVKISTNGGTDWTVLRSFSADDRGPRQARVDISAYMGSANTQLQYSFVSPGGNWWFQVDDVEIRDGNSCVPQAGGLVVGNVYDAINGGVGFNGAEVTNSEGVMVTAVETPDDPNVDDGFYITFSPAGTQMLTATVSLPGYNPVVKTTNVIPSDTVRLDFILGTNPGVDLSDDDAMAGVVGEAVVYTVQITNTGDLTDTYALSATGWPASMPDFITVDLGDMVSFPVTVTIPTGQGLNITGTTMLRATSQINNLVYDSVSLVTTGTPVKLYLPAILKP